MDKKAYFPIENDGEAIIQIREAMCAHAECPPESCKGCIFNAEPCEFLAWLREYINDLSPTTSKDI